MSVRNWLTNFVGHLSGSRGDSRGRNAKSGKPNRRTRLLLEVLESRLAPASLTVNTLADNITDTSVLTLRDAVGLVNNAGDPSSLGQASMPGGWAAQITGSFGSNDTIQFDPSLFGPSQQTITLGGSELLVSQSVTINSPGVGQLAVSGNQASRVLEITSGATATISSLTIENGFVGSNGYPYTYGGGVLNEGTLTVHDITVTGNTATDFGGGIANFGTLTVSGSTLSHNIDLSFGAGGIFNEGTVTVSDSSTISFNSARNGGGIYNDGGTLTVSNSSTISGNSAPGLGGGILNEGTATVSGSTVSGNTAGYGGGVYNFYGTLKVSGSTLSGNSATSIGGGIVNLEGTVTISDSSTLSGNSARDGGGIYNTFPFGSVAVNDSIITGNTASSVGGGIYNPGSYYHGNGRLNVTDSTICGNSAPLGADLSNHGIATLTNSDICIMDPASTTTTLTSSNSATVFGQVVTLTAMVAAVSDTPTGTVAFLVDGYPLDYAAPNSTGQATLTTSSLPAGTHTISAIYLGDVHSIRSTSAVATQVVSAASTTTTIASSAANSTAMFGQSVTFTVTVGAVAPGAGTPTGTVQLQVDGNNLGSPLYGYGTFSLATSALSLGTHTITASYSGDANFIASTAAAFSQIVIPASTTTTVTSSSSSSVFGQVVTVAAAVTTIGTATPAGTVSFLLDGSTPLGNGTLDNTGQASVPVAGLSLGTHTITASYSGNANFIASTSAAFTQVVSPDSTSTTVVSSSANSTSVFGRRVTFTVTVGALAPGAGTPTGTVQLQVDGHNLGGQLTLDANANASLSTSALPVGGHSITAVYSGDSHYLASNGLLPGTISTFAGNGTLQYLLPGPAKAALLSNPLGVAVDGSGNLFIADTNNNVVRKVDSKTGVISTFGPQLNLSNYDAFTLVGLVCDAAGDLFIADIGDSVVVKVSPAGIVTTVAGTFGAFGYSGDGGAATAALLNSPGGLAVDAAGDLFIADSGNSVIRKVSAAGIITTVAGNGTLGYGDKGDGGPATAAALLEPIAIATNAAGDLFIADTFNNVIRKVDGHTGIISTVAAGLVYYPQGVAVDAAGNLFIADVYDEVIREVSTSGVVTTVAGTSGVPGYSGDGGAASAAQLSSPTALALDAAGNLFIADANNNVIRRVNPAGAIATVAGGGSLAYVGNGGPATNAVVNAPQAVAVDAAGDLFIVDTLNDVIREVSPAGIITTVAGNGTFGYSGDGGAATAAQLYYPSGVAVDAAGDLFISDSANNVIREVSPAGIITTVAGNGTQGYSGDGGAATAAQLSYPSGVAVDAAGDLFISDSANNVIRKVGPAGIITTVAGNGTAGYSGDGAAATAAQLYDPSGLAVDSTGDLFIADTSNSVIREVSPAGIITTVAGNGTQGYSGDGGAATAAQLTNPVGIAVDTEGDLLIADESNDVIREVSPKGIITTVAGNGYFGPRDDGGPATAGSLFFPTGVAVDAAGNLFIAEHGDAYYDPTNPGRIRKVTPSLLVTQASTTTTVASSSSTAVFGQVMTFTVTVGVVAPGAGMPTGTVTFMNGSIPLGTATLNSSDRATFSTAGLSVGAHAITATYSGDVDFLGSTAVFSSIMLPDIIRTVAGNFAAGPGYSGDGGQATLARLNFGIPTPSGGVAGGVAVDAHGDLFIADNFNNVIRKVSPAGVITTVAGNGTAGYSGDGGLATNAELDYPFAVTLDAAGDLFIADTYNNVIREVSPGGIITTVAGNGTAGYSGDGGYAPYAQLYFPTGVAVDSAGDLFIADDFNSVVREVRAGIITTVAGTGTQGYSGDGGPATAAQLGSPGYVAVDAAGDLFIADVGLNDNVIRKVSPAGLITTVAGNGIEGYSGDGGSATKAELNFPAAVAVDAAGNLFIADTINQVIREVSAAGIITTVAGNGTHGYSGDGGPATAAQLYYPYGVAVDAAGDLFIADTGNDVVREVTPSLVVNAVTAANLQQVLATTGSITIQAATNSDAHNVINAVNGLPSHAGSPVTLTLNLAAGTFTDITASPPPGVTLVINGNGTTTTLVGKSPALTVTSGTVIVTGITFTTASNAPTILVRGGTLTLRNDTVQESTGFSDAAIAVTGGTLDLGTTASPGNNILNINGQGGFVKNSTATLVSLTGDTLEFSGAVLPSIYVLDPTARGALTLSGNASLNVPGLVQVNSTSSAAVLVSDSAQLTASVIDVAGGFKQKDNATMSVTPATGVSVADPLAGLTAPSTTGLTNYGSVNLKSGSLTINPGIYSEIDVSGKGSLTLKPGIYIIQGGGLTVTGNASISGTGVLIYNAASVSGKNFGGITLSGKGTFNLTAAVSGPYAGVVIFQARDNTCAIDLDGNANGGINGIIYAANANLSMSGKTQLKASLVVGTLTVNGNGALT